MCGGVEGGDGGLATVDVHYCPRQRSRGDVRVEDSAVVAEQREVSLHLSFSVLPVSPGEDQPVARQEEVAQARVVGGGYHGSAEDDVPLGANLVDDAPACCRVAARDHRPVRDVDAEAREGESPRGEARHVEGFPVAVQARDAGLALVVVGGEGGAGIPRVAHHFKERATLAGGGGVLVSQFVTRLGPHQDAALFPVIAGLVAGQDQRSPADDLPAGEAASLFPEVEILPRVALAIHDGGAGRGDRRGLRPCLHGPARHQHALARFPQLVHLRVPCQGPRVDHLPRPV